MKSADLKWLVRALFVLALGVVVLDYFAATELEIGLAGALLLLVVLGEGTHRSLKSLEARLDAIERSRSGSQGP